MTELIDKKALSFTKREQVMCGGDIAKAFKLLCKKINNAPTIEAEPVRHGRWVYLDTSGMFKCSVCGGGAVRNDYPFCMWCGAIMDEVEE